MKYFFTLLLFAFFSCNSQLKAPTKLPLNFEMVNYFTYPIIAGDFEILNSQEKIDAVYAIIHSKTEGNRLAPIPNYSTEETYIVLKPELKKENSIEIKSISLSGQTLLVELQELNDPQINPTTKVSPYVLVKILDKISATKLKIQSNK